MPRPTPAWSRAISRANRFEYDPPGPNTPPDVAGRPASRANTCTAHVSTARVAGPESYVSSDALVALASASAATATDRGGGCKCAAHNSWVRFSPYSCTIRAIRFSAARSPMPASGRSLEPSSAATRARTSPGAPIGSGARTGRSATVAAASINCCPTRPQPSPGRANRISGVAVVSVTRCLITVGVVLGVDGWRIIARPPQSPSPGPAQWPTGRRAPPGCGAAGWRRWRRRARRAPRR